MSRFVAMLEESEISWCMIGGLAVNHWALEPMTTAVVDLVIATDELNSSLVACEEWGFTRQQFPHSINLKGHSKVSIQITTAEFYREFPSRALPADVQGILMRVASLEDTLAGKIAAYTDAQRRPSKRQKDLADISRLIEAHPHLLALLPENVAQRLEQ